MWLKGISRARLVGAWCAAVIVLGACSVVQGAALTISNGEWWLLAGLAPPAIMLLVWRDAPPLTVAALLHSVNRPSKELQWQRPSTASDASPADPVKQIVFSFYEKARLANKAAFRP